MSEICDSLWSDYSNDGWVEDNDPIWGICYPGFLYQIHTDENYVYAGYSGGLDIIDTYLETKVAFINHEYGFTSVCGDSDVIYLGTLTSGIKYINKTCISGSYSDPIDLTDCLNNFDSYHQPPSTRIRNLFIKDNNLSIVTLEGIDVIGLAQGREFHSSTTASGITRSFLTSKRELYYISYDNFWQVNKVNSYLFDWEEPDEIYSADSSFIESSGTIFRDLYVTENTSVGGDYNTLFLATSSGVYVYDEGTSEFSDLPSVYSGIVSSDNFVSIWADPAASLTNGKFYSTSENALYVIDLETNEIVDKVTQTFGGAPNEILEQDDIGDLNIGG